MAAVLASAAVPLYLFRAVRVYHQRAGGGAGAAGGAGGAGPGPGTGRGEEMWAGAQAGAYTRPRLSST